MSTCLSEAESARVAYSSSSAAYGVGHAPHLRGRGLVPAGSGGVRDLIGAYEHR
jgi:hypothetical protein